MRFSDQSLQGRTVIAADGQAVGEIAVIFLDSESWRVESFQVKLRKPIGVRLGAAQNVFHAGTLEVPIRLVQSIGDAVMLSVGVDGLRQVLPVEGASAAPH